MVDEGQAELTETGLRELLARVQAGETGVEAAYEALRSLPFEDLGFAKVDHHREVRTGFPEVIFGQGKTPDQVVAIATALVARGANVLATRVSPEAAERLKVALPGVDYHPEARVAIVQSHPVAATGLTVVVASGGTSDQPVAEEAALTVEALGNTVVRLYDVGVAGIHRILSQIEPLRAAQVVIVVAGMEGALASVVAGLTDVPVIAVPTSVGYGSHFAGLTPLLAMLNSCASGLGVVNIDNGFGAGYLAATITRQIQKAGNPRS